ncbi:hypothetical protein PVAP13_9KG255626 [Panicum virgatum]|uniref:Uncharacterized protein n=1 Tax=Panicum virgatum TaxID=38727 RepID=A0A8T0NLW8_PANVG|nr:hypothetical protein PVAP13_9KG255626 [Panicum virgatum]
MHVSAHAGACREWWAHPFFPSVAVDGSSSSPSARGAREQGGERRQCRLAAPPCAPPSPRRPSRLATLSSPHSLAARAVQSSPRRSKKPAKIRGGPCLTAHPRCAGRPPLAALAVPTCASAPLRHLRPRPIEVAGEPPQESASRRPPAGPKRTAARAEYPTQRLSVGDGGRPGSSPPCGRYRTPSLATSGERDGVAWEGERS